MCSAINVNLNLPYFFLSITSTHLIFSSNRELGSELKSAEDPTPEVELILKDIRMDLTVVFKTMTA